MLYTLLLTDTYEFIDFLSFKKTIKHICKNKVDILSEWTEDVSKDSRGNKINYQLNIDSYGKIIYWPSIIRLKNSIPRRIKDKKWSDKAMFRRDHYLCQYCGEALTTSQATVDHVIPKSKGGTNSWENCVTACRLCNNYKGNRTPEEAGMKLKRKPEPPPHTYHMFDYYRMDPKHPEWKMYLGLE